MAGLADAIGAGASLLGGLIGKGKGAAYWQQYDAQNRQLGESQSYDQLQQQLLAGLAKQYGYSLNWQAPGTGPNPAGLPQKALYPTPTLTENPNWNPLGTAEFQNARAGLTAQNDATKRQLMAGLAARYGMGQVQKGNSEFNINQNMANQDAAFGRQYAGQQFANKQAFQNTLLNTAAGEAGLALPTAAALGQTAAQGNAMDQQQAAAQSNQLGQLGQILGYIYSQNQSSGRSGSSESKAGTGAPYAPAVSSPSVFNPLGFPG